MSRNIRLGRGRGGEEEENSINVLDEHYPTLMFMAVKLGGKGWLSKVL